MSTPAQENKPSFWNRASSKMSSAWDKTKSAAATASKKMGEAYSSAKDSSIESSFNSLNDDRKKALCANIPRPNQAGGKRRRGTRKYKKGSRSKTRRGRKDFITHKGSKKYNRRGHRQSRNSRGRKGKPYSRRTRRGGNPQAMIVM
tara:strand:+ start:3757 stop:4194 length:438 start_codon:yes stop_codon:yes gene_type:complete